MLLMWTHLHLKTLGMVVLPMCEKNLQAGEWKYQEYGME